MSAFFSTEGNIGSATRTSETGLQEGRSFAGSSLKSPSSSSSSSKRINPNQNTNKASSRRNKSNRIPSLQPVDAIGDAMTVLLNRNPDFNFSKFQNDTSPIPKSRKRTRSLSIASAPSDEQDSESVQPPTTESFRPLFSSRNLHNLQILAKCTWILLRAVRPMHDIPFIVHRIRRPFSIENRKETFKDILWFLILASSLILLECIVISVGVAALSISIWNFGRLLCCVGLSLLIDWKEMINATPLWVREIIGLLLRLVAKVDNVILFGNRWRGREWNRSGFDFGGHYSQPLSTGRTQSLWKLPPPNALHRSSHVIPGNLQRSSIAIGTNTSFSSLSQAQSFRSEESLDSTIRAEEVQWSSQTARHVEAIDYCYIMMREEYIQRQYTRLQRRLSSSSYENSSAKAVGDIPNGIRPEFQSSISSISSIDMFRREFVLDPTSNNISPNEVDEVTGVSLKLHEILEGDDSFDESLDNQVNTPTTKKENASFQDSSNNEDMRSGENGSVSDDGTTTDMNWMDVGTEIGMKLLGSAAVQNALASHDTVEKITTLKEKVDSHFSSHKREIVNSASNKTQIQNLGSTKSINSSFNDLTMSPFSNDDENGSSEGENEGHVANERDLPPIHGHYQLDPYAESLPVHPMWTSAAAAVSPTHSFATTDNPWTREDSTIQSSSTRADSNDIISPPRHLIRTAPDIASPLSHQGEDRMTSGRTPMKKDNVLGLPDMSEIAAFPRKKKTTASKIFSKASPSVIAKSKFRRKKRRVEPEASNSDSSQHLDDSNDTILIEQLSPLSSKPRRPLLLPGVKIAVPLLPLRPDGPKQQRPSRKQKKERFQMATVVSSKRICVFEKNHMPRSGHRGTNCLSITVNLDKCFLRNGQFATMTLRIMDDWGPKYMPKHSKLPMGSCVATSFGLGVLVGWRVEDDCHIVRSLWQHRGSGSACAYLRRDSIHATVEAAIGFEVNTTVGLGRVVGYTHGGSEFRSGRYFVKIKEEGRHQKQVLELNRTDILSCESAKFIPIVEHIRAAAQYQLQIDRYKELHDSDEDVEETSNKMWGDFSRHSNTLWRSFLRAIDEDDDFDEGMNEFIQKCVKFLDQLDAPDGANQDTRNDEYYEANHKSLVILDTDRSKTDFHRAVSLSAIGPDTEKSDSGFWLMNNMFDIFQSSKKDETDARDADVPSEGIEIQHTPRRHRRSAKNYARAFAILKTLTKTITIAKAASADDPNFKIILSICHEFLLFLNTVIKVQQKNMNHDSLEIWRTAWAEVVAVFGPVQKRLRKIGEGIAERMEKHGRRAKARLLRFVDIIVEDEILFLALEQGDWATCAYQIEEATVQAKIVDEQSREHYHKTAQFLYNHFSAATSRKDGAAARNNEKLAQFLLAVQVFAAPRKSILQLFLQDSVLEMLERIFVRAFSKDEVASRMLGIHCSNFQNLRKFRLLKDFTIAGKLWIPLLDAADEEFSWAVSKLPSNAQEYLSPISSLFSLCVVQFHRKDEGDLTKDWLDFLMEEEAAEIIHDLDMKLILALESFSRDIKETMVVLPYYPSIDDDILNLVDDINVDEFVKEASIALEDESKLREFIGAKATIAVERFLDYLPKMSIPVEQRDLGEGWTLTCRGASGGHLTLTELILKRENLTCQVMGGDSLLFPVASSVDEVEKAKGGSSNPISPLSCSLSSKATQVEETSILDVIKEIIQNAQRDGCWEPGKGGIQKPPSDKYAAAVLDNVPVSSVLNCAIDLWRNLEIDDDELLEIAIRDVAYQIQLHDGANNKADNNMFSIEKESKEDYPTPDFDLSFNASTTSSSIENTYTPSHYRFNPRVDPTVLFLEIKKLTFNLENFLFRIEKHESRKTVFDPAFEGTGSILVRDVLIKLRVECAKGYIRKPVGRMDIPVPVLHLSELDVSLDEVKLEVQDTGADWLLNKIVEGFGNRFTDIISANLCDQVRTQMNTLLENLNGYFEENPEFLLGVLDISLDDLEDMTVFV